MSIDIHRLPTIFINCHRCYRFSLLYFLVLFYYFSKKRNGQEISFVLDKRKGIHRKLFIVRAHFPLIKLLSENINQFSKLRAFRKRFEKNKDNFNLHLGQKDVRIFVLGHYLFLIAHSFCSWKTVRFSEQIILGYPRDKHPSIF